MTNTKYADRSTLLLIKVAVTRAMTAQEHSTSKRQTSKITSK
jgi:hypothetical protein